MVRYRLAVGHKHEVMPGNIVGAIANEAGLESKHIGVINIYDDYSTVDLPDGMPKEIFNDLKKARVVGQKLDISREGGDKPMASKKRKPRKKKKPKPA